MHNTTNDNNLHTGGTLCGQYKIIGERGVFHKFIFRIYVIASYVCNCVERDDHSDVRAAKQQKVSNTNNITNNR